MRPRNSLPKNTEELGRFQGIVNYLEEIPSSPMLLHRTTENLKKWMLLGIDQFHKRLRFS